jgi:sugar-specific transcriptional regulator TrmB
LGEYSDEQDKRMHVLLSLGLSSCQARVYLALAQVGPSNTKMISDKSDVSRQDIYRVLEALAAKGLVIKSMARPVRYSCVPIREGIENLAKRKEEEDQKLKEAIGEILEDTKEQSASFSDLISNSQVVIVPRKELTAKSGVVGIQAAQVSLDTIFHLVRAKQYWPIYGKLYKKAAKRGVRVRNIVFGVLKINDAVMFTKRWPFCEFKFLPDPPKILFGLFDSKSIGIMERADAKLGEAGIIIISNKSIVDAMQDYFEILWRKAVCANELMSQ